MPKLLIERLVAHRTVGTVPREQLGWLATTGHLHTLDPGEILTPSTGPVKGLYVVLDGHLSIRVDRGAGPRIVMEWHGGDVTGMLPYSRIKAPPGNVVAEERTDVLAVAAERLPDMIRECHELTAVFVHVMLDRARVFKSSELLDEKVASLGRLAAGLAHELNNPASAVARSAKTLVSHLGTLDSAAQAFCALGLSDVQTGTVIELRDRHAAARPAGGPMEIADRQDALEAWLAAHDLDGTDGEVLARWGYEPADLDVIAGAVGAQKLGGVLRHEGALLSARQLAAEIESAATRIHSLVAAVKGFTYVNQQTTPLPLAIGQGLNDTITVLRSKARLKSVEIELKVPEQLPSVEGYGGELNQVWANLVDNAIDAAPGGRVRIEAAAADNSVVVRVVDNGPGIPGDVAKRIFDPFFTTKGIGEGTGLGLDIARRIVQRHRGAIDVSTGPDGTEFRVTLPAAPAASGPGVTR
jgi:signal transduction histidine kinase